MDITKTSPLWLHEEGRIACPAHGGNYLACAIQADPHAVEHETLLGIWALATEDDIAYFEEVGVPAVCETCGVGTK